MPTGAVTLCEFDDDHIQGIAVGPTQEDVIVTAQEDGVFLHSSVSKVSVGRVTAPGDDLWAQQIALLGIAPAAMIRSTQGRTGSR